MVQELQVWYQNGSWFLGMKQGKLLKGFPQCKRLLLERSQPDPNAHQAFLVWCFSSHGPPEKSCVCCGYHRVFTDAGGEITSQTEKLPSILYKKNHKKPIEQAFECCSAGILGFVCKY